METMPDSAQLQTYARLLRLTPVEDAAIPVSPIPPPAETGAPAAPPPAKRHRRTGLVSFLALVVLPTCLAAGYFWLLAADRFHSEARFVLRTPNNAFAGVPGAQLMQAAGVTRSADDGYVVQEYLESRDAMAILEKNAGLRDAWARPRLDFIWRFPNFHTSNSEEGLYRHYRRMVDANFTNATGVTTLEVQAFSAAEARRLAGALLDAAENLVNRLNQRQQRDATALADSEVERMRHRTLAAQAALTAFRERERLLDPAQATLAVLETIAKLAQEAAQVSVQIGELAHTSPGSPQIAPLRTKRAAIEAQIAIERKRLAGDAEAIAPRIALYERLMLEREFAEKALIAAMTSLEAARVNALRQHVYLERITAPSDPDYPASPWRFVWTIAVFAAGFVAWRIWRILITDTMAHGRT